MITRLRASLLVLAVLSAKPQLRGQAAVTWSQQIAPLLYSNCTTCHRPGGAGPFSLLTYQDARQWGPRIKNATSSRYMPPWLPEHGYGEFQDERTLTGEQIAEIARWVQTGMPQGDLSAAPPAPQYRADWQYGTPDLILTVERPLLLPASGTDVFQNFILPYPLKQTHFIRAMEIRPVAPRIVHHANILIRSNRLLSPCTSGAMEGRYPRHGARSGHRARI
jgi:mono/diheme cytochrome c family protein